MSIIINPPPAQIIQINYGGSTSVIQVYGGPAAPGAGNGSPGAGVAPGGTTGQFLKKRSSTNYDTVWGLILAADIPALDWAKITTGKPTTLAGYGITDAYPLAGNPSGFLTAVPAQSFSSLTGTPTTLAGYGITDAYPLTGNPAGFLTAVPAQSFASLTGTPTTLAGYGITDAYPLAGNPSNFLTAVPAQSFSSLTGKPTTLSGYGITDAYPLAGNPSNFLTAVPAQSFSSLTGKPTTLSGYGITDAYPLTGNPSAFLTAVPAQSFASLTGKPTTLAGYGITDAYPLTGNPAGFLTAVPAQSFSSLTGKPTTVSGYGITDALSNALLSGKINIGNASNIATATTLTGDVTINNTGVTAIGVAKVTNAMLAGSISDVNLASSYILANGSRPLTANFLAGAFSIESKQTVATAANVYDGFLLTNTTAATSGNQQYSSALIFEGQGWKTTATAASQSVKFRAYVLPIQGITNPTANLIFESSINGAAFGSAISFTSAGSIILGTTGTIYGPGSGGNINITTNNITIGAGYSVGFGGSSTFGAVASNLAGYNTYITNNCYFGTAAILATARVHIKAGTATASTAPLKLTAGTNLTIPEAGAFEFDGTNLFFTIGSTRKTVTLT